MSLEDVSHDAVGLLDLAADLDADPNKPTQIIHADLDAEHRHLFVPMRRLRQEKRVLACGHGVWVVGHRGKISNLVLEKEIALSSAVADGSENVGHLFIVTAELEGPNEEEPCCTTGILRINPAVADDIGADPDEVVQALKAEGATVLTGYFGDQKGFVEDICTHGKALGEQPLVQPFWWEGCVWFVPAFFIFFGRCHLLVLPSIEKAPLWTEWARAMVERGFPREEVRNNQSFEQHMLKWSRLPRWEWPSPTDLTAVAAFLGNIKTKPMDTNHWYPGVHQVVAWIGTARPSASSQQKQAEGGNPRYGKTKYYKGHGKGGCKGAKRKNY